MNVFAEKADVLDVCDLTALVLQVQRLAGRVLDDLRAVGKAVDGLAALDGLDQGGRGGLPLGATSTGAGARHLALRNCHGFSLSLAAPQRAAPFTFLRLGLVCRVFEAGQIAQGRPSRIDGVLVLVAR